MGFLDGLVVKNLPAIAKTPGVGPWEDPLEKEMQPIPVCLPRKSNGQRSLVGCSLWGHKRVGHDIVTEYAHTL